MKKHCWDLLSPEKDHLNCERCCRCGHSYQNINKDKIGKNRLEDLRKSKDLQYIIGFDPAQKDGDMTAFVEINTGKPVSNEIKSTSAMVDLLNKQSNDFLDREYAAKIGITPDSGKGKTYESTWTAVTDPLYYVRCPHCQADIMMSKITLIDRLVAWAKKFNLLKP